jgi:hypothetical protein
MTFFIDIEKVQSVFTGLTKATADMLAWISILIFNAATIPTFIAVMMGHTDKMPSLDITLLVWVGLILYFIRSAIIKDMLMVVTIGLGFAIQAVLLGIIFFK